MLHGFIIDFVMLLEINGYLVAIKVKLFSKSNYFKNWVFNTLIYSWYHKTSLRFEQPGSQVSTIRVLTVNESVIFVVTLFLLVRKYVSYYVT